jgi:hypothetical protein
MRALDSLHGVILEFFVVNWDVITSPDALGGLPDHDYVIF